MGQHFPAPRQAVRAGRYNKRMYSPQVLDHFEHPRNVGEMEDATGVAEVSNPACGDVMKLWLRLAEGHVEEATYRAKGCVPAIACGSALTELLRGRSIHQARALRRVELVLAVGGLPNASMHASHLAIDVLAKALTAAEDKLKSKK